MKNKIVVLIGEEKEASVKTEMEATNRGAAWILSPTWEELPGLLEKARKELETAEPIEEGQEGHQPDTITAGQEEGTSERKQKRLERAKKEIESAKLFLIKKHCPEIKTSHIEIIAGEHDNNFINGSFDLMALAFKAGYNKAIKEKAE